LDWNEIEEGQILTGKVVRIEKSGVFVDIGAERPGLVHISEMAHGYINKPEDVVSKGQEVEVKVIGINRSKRQIDLSMKAVAPEPQVEEREEERQEELPTAMQIALERALAQSKENEGSEGGRKKQQKRGEQEDIIRRTLERHNRGS